MENIHITKVTKLDLPLIQEIENEAFPSPWLPEHFEPMAAGGCHFLKMNADDELVGYAILHVGFPNCDLFKLAIKDGHRIQGLGEQLLNHCAQIAREAGETVLLLNARSNDPRAMMFYERMGLTHGSVLKDYYHYDENGVQMNPSAIVMSLIL